MSEVAHETQPVSPAAAAPARPSSVPRIAIQGFFETPEAAQTFAAASADRRLSKAHTDVQMGGIDAAIEHFAEAPTPNLVIVETRSGRDAMLAQLASLAEVCDAGTRVIVVGHLNDVILYRELMREGVSEYLVAPIDEMTLIDTIASLYNDPTAAPVGRVIAFVGAKGGVGSSTIAHNVSWAISGAFSEDVIVADLDLAFGTAGLNFNQDPPQGIAEALTSPERLDEVFLDRLLTKCAERLSLFAAPAVVDRDFQWEPSSLEAIIDVVRRQAPCFVIDVPHMWKPWVRDTLVTADEIVITAEPDLANLRNAKNLVDLLRTERRNDRSPHLVLNKVGVPKRPEIGADDFAGALELKPSSVIGYEPQLFGTAANNGQMLEETDAAAKATKALRDLACDLTGRGDLPKKHRSGLSPLLGKLLGRKG